MRGLEYITGWTDLDINGLTDDNSKCLGESELVSLELGAFDVLWNTGETSSSLDIFLPGEYYASIYLNDCLILNTDTLIVLEEYEVFLDVEICAADSVEVNGIFYDAEGIFLQNYFTEEGCDSIYIIAVEFTDNFSKEESHFLCDGEELNIYELNITEPGTFDVILEGQNCDTILTLEILPADLAIEEISIDFCQNEFIEVNNITYDTDGTYIQNLISHQGCDSTLIVNVNMLDDVTSELTFSFCDGFIIEVNEELFQNEGWYTQLFSAENGCDSLLHIQIITTGIFIPNVFTPNQPSNESFYPFISCDINVYQCHIFDRWGNLVFYTDKLIEPWDGRILGGQHAEEGVYTYLMEFGQGEGNAILRTGDVLLLK